MNKHTEIDTLLGNILGACQGISMRSDVPDTVRAWALTTSNRIDEYKRVRKDERAKYVKLVEALRNFFKTPSFDSETTRTLEGAVKIAFKELEGE